MPLIDKQLQEVWDALRADNNRRDHALQSIRIRNLRGIQDIARLAGRTEAEKKRGDMARFLVEFEERIAAWRQP